MYKKLINIRFSQDNPLLYGINVDSKYRYQNNQIRSSLISSSLRVDRELMPGVRSLIDSVISALAIDFDIEVYVYNESTANAVCVDYGAKDGVIIMLSSGLIQLLSDQELKFVIGHEIGHYIFDHHSYPNPETVKNKFSRLNIYELQRSAEISADRVGFLCSDSMETVFRTILKVTTGLPDSYFRLDFSSYIQQLNDLKMMGGDVNAIDQTHPIQHIRLKALLLFSMTPEHHQYRSIDKFPPLTLQQVDKKIVKSLNASEGYLLDEIRNASFEKAELWSLLFIAFSDNKLSKDEQIIIRRRFDEETANKAIEFARSHGPAGVQNKFEESMQEIRNQPEEYVKVFKKSIYSFIEKLDDGSDDNHRFFQIINSRLYD